MPTNVIMPKLGESVVEGTISRWLKAEGDTVQEYEPLLEISTDKVDSEIPAPAEGVLLKIHVAEGETVEHGTLLAVIGQPGEKPESVGAQHAAPLQNDHAEPAAMHANVSTTQIPQNGHADYTGHVTPVVARMAAEHH